MFPAENFQATPCRSAAGMHRISIPIADFNAQSVSNIMRLVNSFRIVNSETIPEASNQARCIGCAQPGIPFARDGCEHAGRNHSGTGPSVVSIFPSSDTSFPIFSDGVRGSCPRTTWRATNRYDRIGRRGRLPVRLSSGSPASFLEMKTK